MKTGQEGHYTITDLVVAILLALIAAAWIIAYAFALFMASPP